MYTYNIIIIIIYNVQYSDGRVEAHATVHRMSCMLTSMIY